MYNEGILKIMAGRRFGEKIVLSFHDSLLRESDLKLLEEGFWLNDNLISFVYEYFEHEEYKDACDSVLFVSPNVTQFIKLAEGPEVGIFLEPLNLSRHQLLFFVVNNNESRTTTGGSHWSLLVYQRSTNSFFHYDSFNGSNTKAARHMAKNVQPFLNAEDSPCFIEEECPQQPNGCDCGVYVICVTEHLCKEFLGLTSTTLMTAVNAATVSTKRRLVKQLIIQLGNTSKK